MIHAECQEGIPPTKSGRRNPLRCRVRPKHRARVQDFPRPQDCHGSTKMHATAQPRRSRRDPSPPGFTSTLDPGIKTHSVKAQEKTRQMPIYACLDDRSLSLEQPWAGKPGTKQPKKGHGVSRVGCSALTRPPFPPGVGASMQPAPLTGQSWVPSRLCSARLSRQLQVVR